MSDLPPDPQLPTPIAPAERLLTAAEFHRLAEVPPEIEWFANIRNRSTRRASWSSFNNGRMRTAASPCLQQEAPPQDTTTQQPAENTTSKTDDDQ